MASENDTLWQLDGPAPGDARFALAQPLVAGMALALAGAAIGVAVAPNPLVGALLLVALAAVCYALLFRRAMAGAFLRVLAIVLAGYALFGRSFAYLGIPPLYVGDLTLALGVLAATTGGSLGWLVRSPVAWLIAAFAAWGALRTAPYTATFGFEALRDAALWGYALFTPVVAACIVRTRSLPAIVTGYGRWILVLAVWLPVVVLLNQLLGASVPFMPGTGQPLLSAKSGDGGVHLAGAACLVLLGLGSAGADRGRSRRSRLAFWALWLISMLFVASLSRGGFVSVIAALGIVAVARPVVIGPRMAAGAIAVAMAAMAVVVLSSILSDPSRPSTETDGRSISVRQVLDNMLSISGGDSPGDLSNTRTWRLDWWREILEYTVLGNYFWMGKGFGLNLADDDGFQVARPEEAPLRSPHNVFMTVLARMGVPGLVLWLALLASFALSLIRACVRARAAGDGLWAAIDLWILSYWSAFLVNASFDVFLEGPQGGIWFWCLMGIGLAALEAQRTVLGSPGRRRQAL
jgi:hypothetical protein